MLWELVLIGEPLAVMAPSPTVCSQCVQALVRQDIDPHYLEIHSVCVFNAFVMALQYNQSSQVHHRLSTVLHDSRQRVSGVYYSKAGASCGYPRCHKPLLHENLTTLASHTAPRYNKNKANFLARCQNNGPNLRYLIIFY